MAWLAGYIGLGAGIASPLKKVAVGVKVAKNFISKGKQDTEVVSQASWDQLSSKPVEIRNLSKSIHDGKQGKHIEGHNDAMKGKSKLNPDIDPQQLLNGIHSGQYKIVGTGSRGQIVVDFGKPIGVDYKTGKETNLGTIHSSKTGAHIVPKPPKQ